jgi:hypothetical protein
MEQVQRLLDRFIGGASAPAGTMAGEGQSESDGVPTANTLRASAGRMASAFRPPARNATDEVVRLLGQARAFQAALVRLPDPKGAESRWAPVAEGLAELGRGYHIDWRADPAGWVPRRVSDQELRLATVSLRAAAEDLDEVLGATLEKDKVMDRIERDRARQLLAGLSSSVHDVLKALEHYDDLTIPIQRALRAAASLKPVMETHPGAPRSEPQWRSVNQSLETIARGFGM